MERYSTTGAEIEGAEIEGVHGGFPGFGGFRGFGGFGGYDSPFDEEFFGRGRRRSAYETRYGEDFYQTNEDEEFMEQLMRDIHEKKQKT